MDSPNPGRATRLTVALAAALGFATFLPIGVSYLLLLMLSGYLLSRPRDLTLRLSTLPDGRWRSVLLFALAGFVLWPFVVAWNGPTHEDTASRLFHMVRVVWVIMLGLSLTAQERRAALMGLLAGALWGALVIGIHLIWPLPPWMIWSNLLTPLGNNNSQKMILMACAAGVALWLAMSHGRSQRQRAALVLIWLLLGATVAVHALSRNAYILLVMLPALAMLYRYRTKWAAPGAALIVATLVLVAWEVSPALPERVIDAVTELEELDTEGAFSGSAAVRLRMYQEAWLGMIEHPWMGTGVGSWLEHWDVVAAQHPKYASINNPHNDFLLFGMETGVPGLLLTVVVVAWFAAVNWKARSVAGGVGFLLVAALSVTAMVNAPFRDAGMGMSLIWLMAAATSGVREAGARA